MKFAIFYQFHVFIDSPHRFARPYLLLKVSLRILSYLLRLFASCLRIISAILTTGKILLWSNLTFRLLFKKNILIVLGFTLFIRHLEILSYDPFIFKFYLLLCFFRMPWFSAINDIIVLTLLMTWSFKEFIQKLIMDLLLGADVWDLLHSHLY